MSEGGSRRRSGALVPVAIKAELRRDACALSLADSRRRLLAADGAVRSLESCLLGLSSDPPAGVAIDPALESLRRNLRARHQRELREATGLAGRLQFGVDEARSTLLRAQGLCDAIDALVRLRQRVADQRDARRSQAEIDDEWARRLRIAPSGAER